MGAAGSVYDAAGVGGAGVVVGEHGEPRSAGEPDLARVGAELIPEARVLQRGRRVDGAAVGLEPLGAPPGEQERPRAREIGLGARLGHEGESQRGVLRGDGELRALQPKPRIVSGHVAQPGQRPLRLPRGEAALQVDAQERRVFG